MIELGLFFNVVVGVELFGINTVGDVDGGCGAVFPEEGGIFPGDGSDAVHLADGRELIILQGPCQMFDESSFDEEPGAVGDAFPNQMFHVVCPKYDQGLGVLADGLDVRGHEQGLQLHDVVGVFLEYFDESVGEILRDEPFHMIGFFGKQVLESFHGLHSEVHVDEFDARPLFVVLRDVVGGDIVFRTVDRQYLDLVTSLQKAHDNAVHGHGTAFNGGIGRFVTKQ